MVLGGLFLVNVIIILWRRHAKKKRAEKTKVWATERGVLGGKGGSWWKRMFTPRRRRALAHSAGSEKEERLPRYRDEVVSEHPDSTVDGFIDAYADERSSWEYGRSRSSLAGRSLFSEITGELRKAPEPRVPVREHSMSVKILRTTRSAGTRSTASKKATSVKKRVDLETEAERYARSVRSDKARQTKEQAQEHPGAAPFIATEPLRNWVQPGRTGNIQARNPFRI
jgi:hypothetical protein